MAKHISKWGDEMAKMQEFLGGLFGGDYGIVILIVLLIFVLLVGTIEW